MMAKHRRLKASTNKRAIGYEMNKVKGMEFIEHTIDWANGETLEAILASIAGSLVILYSLLYLEVWQNRLCQSLGYSLVGCWPYSVCQRYCQCSSKKAA